MDGLALNRLQAIIWTNADIIHWRTYAELGRDELKVWNEMNALRNTPRIGEQEWEVFQMYTVKPLYRFAL